MASPARLDAVPADAGIRRIPLIVGTGLAFALTYLFRWLTVEFTNDHFVHLSRGRQILLGDVPVRDFFDPGLILQYYASAVALTLSGQNLLGEAVLTIAFVAAGTALTFWLSARLSGSIWIAAAAAIIAMLAFPRLYSYPKVFFYVLALAGGWRYAHKPTIANAAWLAVITVLAFLFRHDHGLYIGIGYTALIATLHGMWGPPSGGPGMWGPPSGGPRQGGPGVWGPPSGGPRQGLRAFAWYAGITTALLLPFLLFIQLSSGLRPYVSDLLTQGRTLAAVRIASMPVEVDWSAPLISIAPASERRVNVRWIPESSQESRNLLADAYGLTDGIHVGDTTWSYVAANTTPANLRALITDPAVADTHGIDRDAATLMEETGRERLVHIIPLLRLRIAPGIVTEQNALAFVYYLALVVPVLGVVTLAAALWRGTIAPAEAAVAAMAVLLCLIVINTLVRASPDSRLADVAAPVCVLAAWISGTRNREPGDEKLKTGNWRLRTAFASALWLAALWAIAAEGHTGERLTTAGLFSGPSGVAERLATVNASLRERPIDWWAGENRTGVRALARYVMDCTAPSDRLFVPWFGPEIFFYSERGFAGGQVYLRGGWHASPADQRLTIARLQQQRVPIVIVRTANEEEYRKGFPLVYDYVQQQYREAARSTFGSEFEFVVLVDRGLTPVGEDKALGLPCYR